MTPEQEPEPANVAPEQPGAPQPDRRGRRSGRGRRGRGRRRPQAPSPQPSPAAEAAAEPAQPAGEPALAGAEAAPMQRETLPPLPSPPRERQPASPAAVQQAIEEVSRIIETLRGTLDDMEEVLETLELAERQKIADEQEIETLRRGLRQLHRPRESEHHPPRH